MSRKLNRCVELRGNKKNKKTGDNSLWVCLYEWPRSHNTIIVFIVNVKELHISNEHIYIHTVYKCCKFISVLTSSAWFSRFTLRVYDRGKKTHIPEQSPHFFFWMHIQYVCVSVCVCAQASAWDSSYLVSPSLVSTQCSVSLYFRVG